MHIVGFLRATHVTFVKKVQENGDIYTFYFTPKRPLKHIAGQHVLLLLPNLRFHVFSLSSAPDEPYVTISTHVRAESTYKQYLNNMNPGDKLLMCGPVLDFIFKKRTATYVFLAQGIGITPFRSLLVHARAAKLPVETTLIHVDSVDHTFRSQTSQLATHAYYVSNPDEFTQTIEQTLAPASYYYLSGSPGYIKATKQTLTRLGVQRSHMRTDSFLGY